LSDTVKLTFDDQGPLQLVLDAVAKPGGQAALLERETGVVVHVRGHEVTLEGDADGLVERLLRQLYALAQNGSPVDPADLPRALSVLRQNPRAELREVFQDTVLERPNDGRAIVPRSLTQKRYIAMMRRQVLSFGVGPAGTGKTFLAMAFAVRLLADKQVKRIILSRPAIEAGEHLGFLPGTLEEKISPYLRPLYDALHDMVPVEKVARMMERETIEIAPLAYMRGRTLNDAFVILDEAQNTTREQMKMFLTRIGTNTKVVVTGDPSQIDLPGMQRSGLNHALRILHGVEGIGVCTFGVEDVMRHPLVQAIVTAYDRDAKRRAEARERADNAPDGGHAAEPPDAPPPGPLAESPP
jgi:phosphate starvation-inducible protein PhoH and related proteins